MSDLIKSELKEENMKNGSFVADTERKENQPALHEEDLKQNDIAVSDSDKIELKDETSQNGGKESKKGKKEKEIIYDEKGREIIDFDKVLKKKRFFLFVKRCFDLFASLFGLILFFIPFLFIAFLIKCTSKGPVFFRQERVGKGGKVFRIFKFRTMVVDAEAKGLQITVGKDKRITGIGKVLRKTKMDEMPQLINVFLGQMSFVGPRPEVKKYVDMYDDYQKNVLRVKPGITELASIVYRDENEVLAKSENPERTYIEEIMPTKIGLNMQYIKKMGVFYDLKLIFKTFIAILK